MHAQHIHVIVFDHQNRKYNTGQKNDVHRNLGCNLLHIHCCDFGSFVPEKSFVLCMCISVYKFIPEYKNTVLQCTERE